MRNKLSLRREAQPHRGDAPLTPNGKPETFLASWVRDTIVANPGRACTNAAKPPLRPRFCTFSTSKPATFENVTVLHDTKPTFTFSNPRLLLQAAGFQMKAPATACRSWRFIWNRVFILARLQSLDLRQAAPLPPPRRRHAETALRRTCPSCRVKGSYAAHTCGASRRIRP